MDKAIVEVAGKCMEKNLTTIGPYVLPISEQLPVVFSIILKKLHKMMPGVVPKVKAYVPDFKRGIDHFCLHAGGRRVLDGIEKNLKLTPEHMAASRAALYHYGNTSSSSVFYELRFLEIHGRLRRGQRVLQLAFGSGFKCNSSVMLVLRPHTSAPIPERLRSTPAPAAH